MKIAIVMTYFNRLPQLLETIKSLDKYDRDDIAAIIVDDNSDNRIDYLGNEVPAQIIRIREKTWQNSGIPFNIGFAAALKHNPEIIILQNAECYHAGDIIGYAEKHLTDQNYIAFPCYSLSKDDTCPPSKMNNRCATHDGDSAWYNHPDYRPVGYHFCAAITAKNLRKLNGFDERFKDGKDYEDNFLLHQVRWLGLHLHIPPEPYVFHQWHYSTPRPGASNEQLYHELVESKDFRAVHLITPDL